MIRGGQCLRSAWLENVRLFLRLALTIHGKSFNKKSIAKKKAEAFAGVSSDTADSASCHNFLFCEDKIANGSWDNCAKCHKRPVYQEYKNHNNKKSSRNYI